MAERKKLPLGTLTLVDPRVIWPDEARDFTPWLCEANNLALLGEAIGINLEFIGREQSVGGYRLDILAKEAETGSHVIIENQLERTNHNHLGQLVTYASGFEAKWVVWIAREISEEHKQAIEWLNHVASERAHFFAIELELWRIGDSQPAPNFKVVAQPNNWANIVQESSQTSGEPTETKLLQHEFWSQLHNQFQKSGTSLRLRKPGMQNWYSMSIGRSGFTIALTISTRLQRIGCELYINNGAGTKEAYLQLEKDKNAIEAELGGPVEWQELSGRGASRIVHYKTVDVTSKRDWPAYISWMKERAETFAEVFTKRVLEIRSSHEAA